MRKLVTFLALIGAAWLVAELVAPSFVEARIAERARDRTAGAVEVSADVRSFPLLTRLALSGEVDHVEVTVDEVVRQRIPFVNFRLALEGLELDRGALVQRDVQIRAIESGTISADIVLGALGEALGAAVRQAGFRVEGGNLVVGLPGGRSLSVPLPDDLFPCDVDAQSNGARLTLSCTITDVPPQLLKVASEAA